MVVAGAGVRLLAGAAGLVADAAGMAGFAEVLDEAGGDAWGDDPQAGNEQVVSAASSQINLDINGPFARVSAA